MRRRKKQYVGRPVIFNNKIHFIEKFEIFQRESNDTDIEELKLVVKETINFIRLVKIAGVHNKKVINMPDDVDGEKLVLGLEESLELFDEMYPNIVSQCDNEISEEILDEVITTY